MQVLTERRENLEAFAEYTAHIFRHILPEAVSNGIPLVIPTTRENGWPGVYH